MEPKKVVKKKAFLKTCEQFFNAWLKKDWSKVADATQLTWCVTTKDRGTDVSNHLKNVLNVYGVLKTYKIVSHKSINETVKDVKITAIFTTPERETKRKLIARVLCESAPLKLSSKGAWGVNPVSLGTKR